MIYILTTRGSWSIKEHKPDCKNYFGGVLNKRIHFNDIPKSWKKEQEEQITQVMGRKMSDPEMQLSADIYQTTWSCKGCNCNFGI